MSGRSRNRSKAKWTVRGFRSRRQGSSCSTPKRGGAPCHTGMMNGSASNSPSLTQRRKDQTKLEISRCAAELFVVRGENPSDCRRHCTRGWNRTSHVLSILPDEGRCCEPILANGIERMARVYRVPVRRIRLLCRCWNLPPAFALNSPAATPDAIALIRQLQRIIPGDPALRNVWLSLVDDTETALVLVLRELIGPGADPLEVRLLAIAANTAQRMAVAAWVDGSPRRMATARLRKLR